MRGDIEKRSSGIDGDSDISVLFMEPLVSHEHIERSAWLFARTIAPCTHIVTDRLHVGIAASMLGVACTLYDNIYGKNSQIYDFSLKNHFPSTHMVR
jgi:exopolysaccharide biosynthesis predicted pyruvyltransferase EpsI